MALGAHLEQRQFQGLAMTPQMRQSLQLLQMSGAELETFIADELARNPALAREADQRAAAAIQPSGGRDQPDASIGFASDAVGALPWSAGRSGGSASDGFDDARGWPGEGETLADHLRDQLVSFRLSPPEAAIAEVLIDGLDAAGYLRADLTETAAAVGRPVAMVERVLGLLQSCDPVGVAARDVRECLTLQLKEKDRFDPAMAALVDNLELVARRDHAALKRLCGVDDEDLRDMLAELRALTPKPGAAFASEPVRTIVPDVIVRSGPRGLWNVELNAGTLPRVLVDRRYIASIGTVPPEERSFAADSLARANWLVKSLDQRAKTILKVASEIVRQQEAFLDLGVEHLRPSTLKAVAHAIGVHESTVSRVTSNKYMATPRGVFEFKFLFTPAISATDGGEAHSAQSVRHRIRQLVQTEACARDVHSDDRLVELLRGGGVDIARRTVAKYREAMRIPSSVERRRMFKGSSLAF